MNNIKLICSVLTELVKFKTLQECDKLTVSDIMNFRSNMSKLGFPDFEEIHYKQLVEEANNILICLYYPKDIDEIADNIFECIVSNSSFFSEEESEGIDEIQSFKLKIFDEVNNKINNYISNMR